MTTFTYKILDDVNGFGKAMQLSNSVLEAIVTLDVGPRILHFSLCGRENMLDGNCSYDEVMPDGRVWHSYGGHRIWHAPEKFPRSYVIDDSPLEKYEVKENGVVLYQKEEPWTQVQKIMELEFLPDRLVVYNRIANKGAWPIELAVWGQTAFSHNGLLVAPIEQCETQLLPTSYYVFWPYAKMNDPRIHYGSRYITVSNNCVNPDPFKFGYPNRLGWSAFLNHDMCFIKSFTHYPDAKYPDMGCSFEFYTQDWGGEIEDLAPLKVVEPEEVYEHKNEWFVFDGVTRPDATNDDEIAATLEPVLKKAGLN